MKIHVDNEGHAIDAPATVMPVQDWRERMGLDALPTVTAGPLTPEFKKILSEEPGVDRREFDFNFANGDFAKAFASQAESAPLHKSADFAKADALLREFRETHDKLSLREQLEPLVAKACGKLSAEDGSLLRRALNALDLAVLSFFLGKAFAV